MWLAGIIFLVMVVFYFYNATLQQTINNVIAGIANWLARILHLPVWVMTFLQWTWGIFRPIFFVLLGVTGLLMIAWVSSFISQDSIVLVRITAGLTFLITFIGASLSESTKGIRAIFGEKTGLTGPIQRTSTNILLLSAIVALLTSLPGNQFFSPVCLYSLGIYTALLVIWMVAGWEANSPVTIGTKVLKWTFVLLIPVIIFQNYKADNIKLPRWAQNTIEAYEAKVDSYNIEEKTNGQIILATFCTPSIAYTYDKSQNKFTALPSNKYQPGDIVTVAKKEIDPTLSHGESMLEIVTQNKYGDMFGINAWVPARKLEYLSASELREQQKKAIEKAAKNPVYQLLKTVSGHDRKWEVPNPFMSYYFEIPAGSYVIFDNPTANSGHDKHFDNSNNTVPEIFKWAPEMPEIYMIWNAPKNVKINIYKKTK